MAEERILGKYFGSLKGKWLLLLLAALGILLLVFGGSGGAAAPKEGEADAVHARTEAYRLSLEEELGALCSSVRGAGRVTLMITLDGSEKSVYAADTDGDGRTDYVISAGEGLLLSRAYPAVVGVAAVCEGGDDPAVRGELTALICAALDIRPNRVYICATA